MRYLYGQISELSLEDSRFSQSRSNSGTCICEVTTGGSVNPHLEKYRDRPCCGGHLGRAEGVFSVSLGCWNKTLRTGWLKEESQGRCSSCGVAG